MTTTTNPTPPEQAPRIFGKPMTAYQQVAKSAKNWRLEFSGTVLFIDPSHRGFFVGARGWWVESVETIEEGARAIEARLLSTVLAIAPLLDDAAKRELVKAMALDFRALTEDEQRRQREEVLNWDFEKGGPRT